MEGTMMLRGLVGAARGMIELIAGGGVRSGNVEFLMKETGVRWVHSSAIVEDVESDAEEEIKMRKQGMNRVDAGDEQLPSLGELKALVKLSLADNKASSNVN